jgi:hypothetical protein
MHYIYSPADQFSDGSVFGWRYSALACLFPFPFPHAASPVIAASGIVPHFVATIDCGNNGMAASHALGDFIESHIGASEQAYYVVNLKVV